MAFMTEEDLENMSIEWIREIGYSFVHAPDGKSPEREDFRQVILVNRLNTSLKKLNPKELLLQENTMRDFTMHKGC
tara:strand:+ start:25 stop:252 length:228 start_codon:yes stop_codon:yes gene_type:complete